MVLPNKPTILAKIDGNLEPPATLKKSFFLDSGGIDATWLQPTAEDVLAFGQHQRFPLHARKP